MGYDGRRAWLFRQDAWLIVWLASAVPSWAQLAPDVVVQGRGSAVIRNGDVALARWQARADALKNALESRNATVQTGTVVSNGRVFESLSIKTDARTRDVQVLDEVRQGNQLSITLQATLASGAEGQGGDCTSPYRKRAVFTPLPLENPGQLGRGEAPNFPGGLAQILARISNKTGDVAGFAVPGDRILQGTTGNLRARQDALNALLVREQAQFAVAGVVRHLAGEGSGFPWLNGGRALELELALFSPMSEAPLASRRFSFAIPATPMTGPLADVSSPAFAASRVGQALTQGLQQAATWLQQTLTCQPFAAPLIQDGSRFYLAAGTQAGLRDGDVLILFRPGQGGTTARPLASVTLKTVQEDRAALDIGGEAGGVTVRPGDVLLSQ